MPAKPAKKAPAKKAPAKKAVREAQIERKDLPLASLSAPTDRYTRSPQPACHQPPPKKTAPPAKKAAPAKKSPPPPVKTKSAISKKAVKARSPPPPSALSERKKGSGRKPKPNNFLYPDEEEPAKKSAVKKTYRLSA